MIWGIIIAVVIFIAFKLGNKSGEMVSSATNAGGMQVKYSRLVERILNGHEQCRVVMQTRTYIRVGVSNYGGTTMFHIQQSTGNIVLIDYEVSHNPVFPSFTLHFSFPDNMDQDEMYERITLGVQEKMEQLITK